MSNQGRAGAIFFYLRENLQNLGPVQLSIPGSHNLTPNWSDQGLSKPKIFFYQCCGSRSARICAVFPDSDPWLFAATYHKNIILTKKIK